MLTPLPHTRQVYEGERIEIKIRLDVNPEPIIKWYKNDQEIKPSHRISIDYYGGVACLTYSSVIGSDSGHYRVHVVNAKGSVTSEMDFTVLPGQHPMDQPDISGIVPLSGTFTQSPRSSSTVRMHTESSTSMYLPGLDGSRPGVWSPQHHPESRQPRPSALHIRSPSPAQLGHPPVWQPTPSPSWMSSQVDGSQSYVSALSPVGSSISGYPPMMQRQTTATTERTSVEIQPTMTVNQMHPIQPSPERSAPLSWKPAPRPSQQGQHQPPGQQQGQPQQWGHPQQPGPAQKSMGYDQVPAVPATWQPARQPLPQQMWTVR